MKCNFGKFIEVNRGLKDLSMRQAALILKISPSYLSDIEKGRRNPPNYQLLMHMKELYDLSDTEFEYMCNLVSDEDKECPKDIVNKVLEMDDTERYNFWHNVRKLLKEIK